MGKITGNGFDLVRVIAAARKCPIECGASGSLKMTKEGFIEACLKTQLRRKHHGKKLAKYATINSCTNCKRGKLIKAGKDFRKPAGIRFLSLKTLSGRRKKK